jgi:hypothetical protein
MTCPGCGSEESDRVFRSTDLGDVVVRQRECSCGQRWTTKETLVRRNVATNSTPVHRDVQALPPMHVSAHPSHAGSVEGVGGGLSSALDLVRDPIRISRSISAELVSKPRARSRTRANVSYSPEFEEFWEHTGRCYGNKGPAAVAFEEALRFCAIDRMKASWTAYMASRGPSNGCVQHVSTWLNGRGYETDWKPAVLAIAGPSRAAQRIAQDEQDLLAIIDRERQQEAANGRGR